MSEETKISDTETDAEKKKRLRAARELAEELREEALDKKSAEREALRKARKMSRSDIHLEYAKVILVKILESDGVNTLGFAQGNSEMGRLIRERVCFAVSNMASDLTKQHMSLYP